MYREKRISRPGKDRECQVRKQREYQVIEKIENTQTCEEEITQE